MSSACAVTRGDAILVHLNRFAGRDFSVFNMPYEITQDGVASSLGISRAHASLELKKLREKNLIECMNAHVRQNTAKRLVYHIKPQGVEKAEMIINMLERNNIDVNTLFIDISVHDMTPRDPELCRAQEELELAGELIREVIDGKDNRYGAIHHLTEAIKHISKSMEVY